MSVRTSESLRRASGRDRPEWFGLLDEWGAAGRPYREIHDWLTGTHGLSSWWAQKLIVEYEQERGVRQPGARSDGTFTVTASKAVAAPVGRAFAAVTEPSRRERWLPGAVLRERTATPGRVARFDWGEDGSRLSVSFAAAGTGKCQVAVEHERLPDAASAAQAREFWRERLAALKVVLEEAA